MKSNVFITHRVGGRVVDYREGHNVWVDNGRALLAKLVAYSSFSPDTPEENNRVKYMGFGIGGKKQTATIAGQLATTYPAGSDPNATDGKQYNHEYPVNPNATISTLERPIKISGTLDAYPGNASDRWLTDPTDDTQFMTLRTSQYQQGFHTFLDMSAGDFLVSSFSSIPLSEVGLFSGSVTPTGAVAYNTLVAYYNFDDFELVATSELELWWFVNF